MLAKPKKKKPKKAELKRHRPTAAQRPDALAFTIAGFQAVGGPSKTKIYELGKAGVLEMFRDAAGRTMITGKSARALLKAQEN
jgi:hypothetical protein